MKKFRTLLALVLALAMMLTLFGCGSAKEEAPKADAPKSEAKADTGNEDKSEPASYEQVTIAYATFNNIPTDEDLDKVEEEINKITREKIGAEITLMPIPIFEYSQKVSLALQGNEKIDLFQSLGDYGNCIATDMCLDITDIAPEYCKETLDLIPSGMIDACRSNGQLYGIPTYKPFALTPMFVYRKDIAAQLNLDMSKVNSLDDVVEVLRQVKAQTDVTPLAPTQTGSIGTEFLMGDVDCLTDDYYKPIGVMIDGDFVVRDVYTTDNFRKIADFGRTLYTNDLIMKDAATTTSMAAELMASGNYFAYIASYSYPEEDTAASISAQTGNYPVDAKMIGDAYLTTTDINALVWMVSSTSDVPEAAAKFLNLTMTDDDIINLVIYGLEGRDYVMDADGFVSYPEGTDATTVPYTAQLSCGTFGNFFKMYPMAGTSKESLAWELEQNEKAKTSPAMGFTFDASELNTEYTAVRNVLDQYLPGLLCGSLDPETEIPKFVDALNSAGYGTILEEKQKQLNTWKASK